MGRLVACLMSLLLVAAACGSDADSVTAPAAPSASAADAPAATVPTPQAPVVTGGDGAATPSEPADTEPADTTPTDTRPTDTTPADTEPATEPAPPGEPAAAEVSLVEVASFEQPLDLAWAADGTGPYVSEKTGRLYRLDADTGERELILDLSERVSTNSERGLLGSTFSLDTAWLYASFTDEAGTSVVEAWAWDGSPLDPTAGTEIIAVEQPFSNHNGGDVEIGPDAHLYWALGDGGSADDPLRSGQDLSTLLGSILRIDPQPETGGYDIPVDNPFVGVADAAPEIWHYGLRNPWKFAFDPITGDMWIGDVGQNAVEEIDVAPAGVGGLNYGWNCREGDTDFFNCDAPGAVDPVLVYGRASGESVTGGYVYRGAEIAALNGAYVFGDFGSGRVWALGQGASSATDLGVEVTALSAFGQDPVGEVWAVSLFGPVYRLVG